MIKSLYPIKYSGILFLILTLIFSIGCQTPGEQTDAKNASGAAKAGTSKGGSKSDASEKTKTATAKNEDTSTDKKPVFREPDDSWTYLRISTVDESTKQSLTQGYVAMARGEFRLILAGVDLNMKVEVSGNNGKIVVWGANEGKWEGVLDEKTPMAMQPFFMLAQAYKIALDSAMDSGGVKFSFRGLNRSKVEVGEVFFGPVKSGYMFPSDMAVVFEKTGMQISFLIEE